MLLVKGATVFEQRFYTADGVQIGTRTIAPWLGGARNGRLRLGRDDVAKIELAGRSYRLEYEVFNLRGLGGNDIRFFLMDGEATVATAVALQADRMRRWEIDIGSERYELVRRKAWPRLHCELIKDRRAVGTVRETTRLLAVTRTYEVTMQAALAAVIPAFLFHLVMVPAHE